MINFWIIFFAAFIGATVGRLLVFGIERLVWCVRDAKKYRERYSSYPNYVSYSKPNYINYNGGNYYILKDRVDELESDIEKFKDEFEKLENRLDYAELDISNIIEKGE